MSIDIQSLFADHESERYALHTEHMNEQMVRVLKTIGYDVGFVRGQDNIYGIAKAPDILTC